MSAKTKFDIKDRFVIINGRGARRTVLAVEREKNAQANCSRCSAKNPFLQEAVGRVLPLVPAKKHFSLSPTRRKLPEVRKQLPKIPKANLVAEPIGRDTCAAVTLGAALVGARSTTGVMAVLPADHVIPDEKKFQQVLSDAFDVAAQGQAIVTIGIKRPSRRRVMATFTSDRNCPRRPARGKRKRFSTKAERFVEKPNFEAALGYVNSGQYRWNAGMFVWSFITITNGLEKHQPEMFAACQRWFKAANNPARLAKVLAKEYPDIKKISIDFCR